ncbi:MAG: sugar phosphate nucleotidyltransferase [Candidatus Bathyarchaeia archaeon]
MKAVILAAGRGERLFPYTKEHPKPLTPVSGRPILEHVICTFKRAGIRDFVIVTGYLGHAIRRFLGNGSKMEATIRYAQNPSYHRGNATSLAAAQELLKNDEIFILSMADHLLSEHIVERALGHVDRQPLLCVDFDIIQPSKVKEATKVLVGSDGYIKDIGKAIPRWNALDTGLFLLNGAIFEAINDMKKVTNLLSLSHCVKHMIESHELWACDVSGSLWLDIDTWEDLAHVRERCYL